METSLSHLIHAPLKHTEKIDKSKRIEELTLLPLQQILSRLLMPWEVKSKLHKFSQHQEKRELQQLKDEQDNKEE